MSFYIGKIKLYSSFFPLRASARGLFEKDWAGDLKYTSEVTYFHECFHCRSCCAVGEWHSVRIIYITVSYCHMRTSHCSVFLGVGVWKTVLFQERHKSNRYSGCNLQLIQSALIFNPKWRGHEPSGSGEEEREVFSHKTLNSYFFPAVHDKHFFVREGGRRQEERSCSFLCWITSAGSRGMLSSYRGTYWILFPL